jgi:hypothetical protein
MSSELDAYIAARRTADAAEKSANAMVERLIAAVSPLNGAGWKRAHIPGMAGRHARRATQIPNTQLPAWPTWQEVCDAVNAYHTAMLAMDQAYDVIPSDEQSVVMPPPSADRR